MSLQSDGFLTILQQIPADLVTAGPQVSFRSHFIISTEAFASFQPLKKVFKQIRRSALSLFVFWILANDPDAAFSLDVSLFNGLRTAFGDGFCGLSKGPRTKVRYIV